MIFNHQDLFFKIYSILIDNIEKKHQINNVLIKEIAETVFNKDLKNAFYLTTFNLDGHHKSYYDGKTIKDLSVNSSFNNYIEKIERNVKMSLKEIIFDIFDCINKGDPFNVIQEKFKTILNFSYYPVINDDYCSICGQKIVYYMKDGVISQDSNIENHSELYEKMPEDVKKALKYFKDTDNKSTCPYPNGLETYATYITIMSNKLVVANNLTGMFNVDYKTFSDYLFEKSGYHNDINSEVGVMYNQHFWNEKGLIYIQTGNTSPSIYIDSLNGTIAGIESPNLLKNKSIFPIDVSSMKKAFSICTDSWCINAIDMTLFENYCKNEDIDIEDGLSKFRAQILDVEPGKYKVICYNAHRYSSKKMFFSMEKCNND